jgi:hypothetical protein
MSARLDAVSKSKQAYVLARATLEQRLREQLKSELSNLQAQVDMAVRFAYEAGESKANILRSLGTKDYNTVKHSLERTSAVTIVEGEDPLDKVYGFDVMEDSLFVKYSQHGPNEISGEATFDVKKMDDGSTWFMSRDPLWNDNYSVRNEVVAALDGKQDGYYYDEAVRYVNGRQL